MEPSDLMLRLIRGEPCEMSYVSLVDALATLRERGPEEATAILLRFLLLLPSAEDEPAEELGIHETVLKPPAIDALINIGEKAVPRVIEDVRKSGPQDDRIPAAASMVIAGILGDRGARQAIEKEIRLTVDPAERDRLEECLQYISGK